MKRSRAFTARSVSTSVERRPPRPRFPFSPKSLRRAIIAKVPRCARAAARSIRRSRAPRNRSRRSRFLARMSETTMRAARVTSPSEARLELVDVPVPQPHRGEVRIKIAACGICHSDFFVLHDAFPGITYPRIPGHEIAGTVDAVGDDVTGFARRRSRRRRVARRSRRNVRSLPPRRFHHVPQSPRSRHGVRRRLRAIHDRPARRRRARPRRPNAGGSRAADVRRRNHLQLAAQQRRARRRSRGDPRHRRTRPPRRAVRQ